MEWMSPTGRKIVLMDGDITRVPVDAIVNAANAALAAFPIASTGTRVMSPSIKTIFRPVGLIHSISIYYNHPSV